MITGQASLPSGLKAGLGMQVLVRKFNGFLGVRVTSWRGQLAFGVLYPRVQGAGLCFHTLAEVPK